MQLCVDLVLASESPRRRELLTRLGLKFRVVPSGVSETAPPGAAPRDLVRELALRKALAVSRIEPGALVLGADTVVVHGGRILGKPADADHARRMLRSLGGAVHAVHTGMALVHPASGRRSVGCETAEVTFGDLDEREIDAYVKTGAPMDKAGAYGIQSDWGSVFVKRIKGDYFAVVGLPLHLLYTTLRMDFPDLFCV